jgi:DNA modification methylase
MEIKSLLVKDIKYAPYNPRRISEEVLSKLKRSIEEFGYIEPIVVNKRTMHVVGGNQRLKVLRQLDIKEVQAVIVDLDDVHEKALNIALNKINGEWDLPLLKDLLLEIDTGEIDIEITGFDMPEIEGLMNQFHIEGEEDNFNVDEAIEEIKEPTTKTGDIWLLGKHRVMCGDSTIKEDVEKLMDGKKADMVFTDPPYGVNYHSETPSMYYGKGRKGKERDKIIGDENTEIYKKFVPIMKENVVGPMYVFCGAGTEIDLLMVFRDNSLILINTLIWDKMRFGGHALGANYKPRFEMFYYVIGKNTDRLWAGKNNEETLWQLKRDNKTEFHTTQKPIALAMRAITNHTAKLILDLFGGSGSTLIACEQLNRICYMMEIDPVYCDVIVKRWEEYTGKKAELLEN